MGTFNLVGALLNGEDVGGNDALKQARNRRTFSRGPVGVLDSIFNPPVEKKEMTLADKVKEALGNPTPVDPRSYRPGSLADMVYKRLHTDEPQNYADFDQLEAMAQVQKLADAFPSMCKSIMTDKGVVDKSKALSSLANDFVSRCNEKLKAVKK